MTTTQIPPDVAAAITSNSIPYTTPDSPEYASQQKNWFSNPAQPSLIARVQTPEHVAALVSACAAAGQDFVIRAGGHDLNGRSTIEGAVQIDVRDLNSVVVSPDRKTARVGGGATLDKVLGDLDKAGLTAPAGTVGTVGYVGWCTFGGYGPFSPGYGLGADGIVGARLVNAEGKIVDASERLLKGIRGGGPGHWGVILELVIKIYPREEAQAGVLVYDSSNINGTTTEYLTKLEAFLQTEQLPAQLYIQPLVLTVPGQGKSFMVSFLWNGPVSAESKDWQERIAGLGPCIAQAIQTTTPFKNLETITPMLPPYVSGQVHTVSLSSYSPEAIAVIAEAMATMPEDAASGFSIHALQPVSPSIQSRDDAVFLVRKPHYMVEIIGCSVAPESAEKNAQWASSVRDQLNAVDTAIEATYFPLTNTRHVDLKRLWGVHLDELIALKNEFDPQGLFKYALPSL